MCIKNHLVKTNKNRVCKRCIMSNAADEWILFDENEQCNYCNTAFENIGKNIFPIMKDKKD